MPTPPAPTIPGITDTLEFVKNLWGSMNVPGVGVPGVPGMTRGPPLSTDDLDKRIADLKAVENWLNLNTTMLRNTIQALEVQRGTLAALKSMGESMTRAMGGAAGMPGMAAPFAPFFTQPGASAPGAAAQPGPGAQQKPSEPGAGGGPQAAEAAHASDAAMQAAAAWWNLLHEQFQQAMSKAVAPDAMAGAMAMAQDAAARMTGAAPAAGGAPPATPSAEEGGAGYAQPGVSKPRSHKPTDDKS